MLTIEKIYAKWQAQGGKVVQAGAPIGNKNAAGSRGGEIGVPGQVNLSSAAFGATAKAGKAEDKYWADKTPANKLEMDNAHKGAMTAHHKALSQISDKKSTAFRQHHERMKEHAAMANEEAPKVERSGQPSHVAPGLVEENHAFRHERHEGQSGLKRYTAHLHYDGEAGDEIDVDAPHENAAKEVAERAAAHGYQKGYKIKMRGPHHGLY